MDNYRKLFGLNFKVEKAETKKLPIFMSAGRSFYIYSHDDLSFLAVSLPAEEKFGAVALEKQMRQISLEYEMPVAFEFESLSRPQRDSLIERNIPFISQSSQLYLPFLAASLSVRFYHQKTVNSQKMMPTTQMLFLFILYRCKDKPIMKKDAAEALSVTRTTITRACEQLSSMGLIKEIKQGKNHFVYSTETGISYFKQAEKFMINPVQKVNTVVKDKIFDAYPLSGESALAKRTLLNNSKVITRAVYKDDFDLDQATEVMPLWETDKEPVNIELWKYDPSLFSYKGTVDPVSLALTFKENADERIEGAVEEYLEDHAW